MTAIKGAIGHTIGAAGGASPRSPPSGHARRPRAADPQPARDPDPVVGDMDLTPLVARDRDVRVALVNAFGFGGQNSAIVLRRWDD